jgi:hypothetical protein
MEHWEKSYYITAIAGAANGSSLLVVMSKGMAACYSLQEKYKSTRTKTLINKG